MTEPLDKWSNFHDGGRRCGAMTTNMVEIFNNVSRYARVLPVTVVVQLIYFKLVEWFRKRRDIVRRMQSSNTPYGPNFRKVIQQRLAHISHLVVIYDSTHGLFSGKINERNNRGGNVHVVNLAMNHCDCGKWQAMEFFALMF